MDERALRDAVARAPEVAEAHNNLGTFLASQGREEESIACFERAIALKPNVASTHGNLGVALYVLGRLADARERFVRQLELEPDNGNALGLLGVVTLELGDVSEAVQLFERAVAASPRSGWLYRRWAEATTVRLGDAPLLAMESLATGAEDLPPADRVQLHFALGKAYDDLGRVDEAFARYDLANRLHRSSIEYDEAATLESMERVRERWNASRLREPATGDASDTPVFVVGMPRSGTTLVEHILAAHPDVYAAGEIGTFERALTQAGEADPARLGRAYVTALTSLAPAAARITDKMLANVAHLGLIRLALPNARIVLVRRDPLDTCLSCYFQCFMSSQPYSYDLGELGRYYRAYERLAAHWRDIFPPGAMLEIAYEDLVADVETAARAIVAYCGLEWNDACLEFHAAKRTVRTASAAQVRRPLYASSVRKSERYRRYLGPLIAGLDE
ncbi:MAG: sulfotransferase [Candidatus Eremiobacteraeota bacterium]|nr:sulfotransferase [Candidatus Eremiobacteraeota bacterium]